jgi:hypothetical protein
MDDATFFFSPNAKFLRGSIQRHDYKLSSATKKERSKNHCFQRNSQIENKLLQFLPPMIRLFRGVSFVRENKVNMHGKNGTSDIGS